MAWLKLPINEYIYNTNETIYNTNRELYSGNENYIIPTKIDFTKQTRNFTR